MTKGLLCAGLALSALATAAPATAQSAPVTTTPDQTETTPQPEATAGDIVVTARRTAEAARDVPSTITAITAEQLAATGPVSGTGDLLRTVPGVRFNDVSSANLSEVSIRGSGTERATGADSAVGLFVNGAYVGSSTLGGRNFKTLDFFDVARVEVLEGPQGGLYGRNAEYGVVNLVLAQPDFANSGSVSDTFTAGINQNRLKGIVNQQLGDGVAVRLGAEAYGQTSGFYYNPTRDKYYDSTNGFTARGQIRAKQGPLDVDLLVDAQDLRLPSFVNTYILPPGIVATIPLGYTAPRFTVPHDGQDGLRQKIVRTMLLASYDFGGVKLSSTTMVMRWTSTQQFASAIDLATEANFQRQGETGAYPLSQTISDVHDRSIYQDLHLAGSAFDQRLDWLVGGELLFQRDRYFRTEVNNPCTLNATSGICGGTPTAPLCYQLLPTSKACPTPFPNAFGTFSDTRQRYSSEAIYGSVKYRIGEAFTLAGDLRYTHDDKQASLSQFRLYTSTLTTPASNYEFKAGKVNYTASLSYKVPGASGALLYAKTGTGYRAGGINSGVSSPLAPNPFLPTYNDENTTSYEVGFKGNLARNVYLTVDGYYSRTTDAIASINDGCTVLNACKQGPVVFNINGGTVHAKGIEASLDARTSLFGGQAAINLNGARQSAKYVAIPSGYAGLPLLGSSVAQIPDWTASATLDYRHALSAETAGFLHVTYNGSWGGGQDTTSATTPYVSLDDRNQLSLRLGMDYKRFELAFFTQNLLNETVQLLKLQVVGTTYAARFNEPRTYGVSVGYRW